MIVRNRLSQELRLDQVVVRAAVPAFEVARAAVVVMGQLVGPAELVAAAGRMKADRAEHQEVYLVMGFLLGEYLDHRLAAVVEAAPASRSVCRRFRRDSNLPEASLLLLRLLPGLCRF